MLKFAALSLVASKPLTFQELRLHGYDKDHHWTAAHLATSDGDLFGEISTEELCMYVMVGHDRQIGQSTELVYAINTTHAKSLGSIGGFGSGSYLTKSEIACSTDHTERHISTAKRLCGSITDQKLAGLLLRESDPAYAKDRLLSCGVVNNWPSVDLVGNVSMY